MLCCVLSLLNYVVCICSGGGLYMYFAQALITLCI